METFVLALDQGTTSSRAIIFDRSGAIKATAQREFAQIFPQPGWVEHHAEEIWESQLAVGREALQTSGISAQRLCAIGITNQRETTLVWERASGRPIANAIVWQDRRTARMCEDMAQYASLIQQRTGLVLDAYFSATKLKYLLDTIPEARARAERGELAFGTVDSWLTWKLTGRHVTDPSNASRTMLFNIHTQHWDDELLGLFDVPKALLPEVVPSSGFVATTYPEWFGTAVPVAGLCGDQQAATFGQACHHPGMAKNTYGTGCFMLMNTGAHPISSQHRLLTTIGWSTRETASAYMLEGSVFMGGATIQWLRDGLGIIQHSDQVEALARTVPDTGGVMMVPAFTGLGAPYWDPHARAALLGMTRGTTKAHIARAALQAIALQSADLALAMQQDAGIAVRELRVDGGAARNDLLMQMQADLLGVSVVRPKITETTALGAAYLAGLALGFWESEQQIAEQWQMECRFDPTMGLADRTEIMQLWHNAVQRSRG